MPGIFHIPEMVSLALHGMVYIAGTGREPVNVREICQSISCSEAHLVKALQRLVKKGLLYSIRGPKGGFGLSRPAAEISLLEIYQALEGPVELGGCPTHRRECNFSRCILDGIPDTMNREFIAYLESRKLSDFILAGTDDGHSANEKS